MPMFVSVWPLKSYKMMRFSLLRTQLFSTFPSLQSSKDFCKANCLYTQITSARTLVMKVIFTTDKGDTVTVKTTNPDLTSDGKLVIAEVTEGEVVVYNNTHYNPKGTDPPMSQVIVQGQGPVTLDFPAKSVRPVPEDATVLYEQSLYGGTQEVLVAEGEPDIPFEVSSMIITSGTWDLFSKTGYQGASTPKDAATYPDPTAIGFTMKSIRN